MIRVNNNKENYQFSKIIGMYYLSKLNRLLVK